MPTDEDGLIVVELTFTNGERLFAKIPGVTDADALYRVVNYLDGAFRGVRTDTGVVVINLTHVRTIRIP